MQILLVESAIKQHRRSFAKHQIIIYAGWADDGRCVHSFSLA